LLVPKRGFLGRYGQGVGYERGKRGCGKGGVGRKGGSERKKEGRKEWMDGWTVSVAVVEIKQEQQMEEQKCKQ